MQISYRNPLKIRYTAFITTMEMKAKRLFYSGRVQGVGFRYSVKQIAAGFDLSGTVRNLMDGRVELFLQGEQTEIEEMEKEILESHLKGFLKEVEAHDVEVVPECKGFSIVS